jgi:hypothetical protein
MALPNTGIVGVRSYAQGESIASRDGQFSYGSGPGGIVGLNQGDSQESRMTMTGSTPGLGIGESVELKAGLSPGAALVLEDSKSYAIVITGIARGAVLGLPLAQFFRRSLAVSRDAGLSTILALGALEQLGNAGAASWTLLPSIPLIGPDRFVLTFNTGVTTSAVRVTAKVEFVEMLNPP